MEIPAEATRRIRPSWRCFKQASKLDGISGIELVGTRDIRPDNVKEMKTALNDLDFECVSIIADLFEDKVWRFGTNSARDPKFK